LSYGLNSIVQSPLVGVGPGNFLYASMRYKPEFNTATDSSHNIFFDIFTENGKVAGLIFAAILILVFSRGKSGVFPLLALAMLLNFQTDYTFRIYSFFILFCFLLGLIYREKNVIMITKNVLIVPSLLLFFALILIGISNALTRINDYKKAFYFYPLNQDVYQVLIENDLKTTTPDESLYLKLYSVFFQGDPDTLFYLGAKYEQFNQHDKALLFYKSSYEANPFQNTNITERIYYLLAKVHGERDAREFIDKSFTFFQNVGLKSKLPKIQRSTLIKLCKSIYFLDCPFEL
jgi:hypothetical protein